MASTAVHLHRALGKALALCGCQWQPRFPLRGWVCREELVVVLQLQRPPRKAPVRPGRLWPKRACLGGWVHLGGQGPPLGQQRPSGKALAKTECLCRPGAHLGGLSGLEGCGAGSVALAEGPCLYCRMTPASAGCVPLAVQAAGWPLAQAAWGPRRQGSTQPRELLPGEEVVASRMAGEPPGWAGP